MIYNVIDDVPPSAFAIKTPVNYTFTPIGSRIYIKKMRLRQLTAVEQRISAVNCRRVSFLANSKMGTTIIL